MDYSSWCGPFAIAVPSRAVCGLFAGCISGAAEGLLVMPARAGPRGCADARLAFDASPIRHDGHGRAIDCYARRLDVRLRDRRINKLAAIETLEPQELVCRHRRQGETVDSAWRSAKAVATVGDARVRRVGGKELLQGCIMWTRPSPGFWWSFRRCVSRRDSGAGDYRPYSFILMGVGDVGGLRRIGI